jgi:RES domain
MTRRAITQTIAADLFDQGASAVRFPSRLDGNACVALFGDHGIAAAAGDPIALTDPPPEPLTNVTAPWRLVLEPAPAIVRD